MVDPRFVGLVRSSLSSRRVVVFSARVSRRVFVYVVQMDILGPDRYICIHTSSQSVAAFVRVVQKDTYWLQALRLKLEEKTSLLSGLF